jgi:carboxylate/amino acid/amine transporter
VLSKRTVLILSTAIAPALWGTTYLTTTNFLPPDRPLLAATLRALPAGIILLAMCRQLPGRGWWWRSWLLGTLNIGAFFALLFVAAYRLPGGVAAIFGGIQPLLVAVLASRLLAERLTARTLLAGTSGVFGVSLIVLTTQARLDTLGILAAAAGTGSMALGIVLTKKWGRPASPLTTTAWQLVAGGLTLAIALLLIEGLPGEVLTPLNLAGYLYLSIIGTAVAYVLWFHGIAHLPATTTGFLGLLSPVVALLLGWAINDEQLEIFQAAGVVIVLVSIVAVGAKTRGLRLAP